MPSQRPPSPPLSTSGEPSCGGSTRSVGPSDIQALERPWCDGGAGEVDGLQITPQSSFAVSDAPPDPAGPTMASSGHAPYLTPSHRPSEASAEPTEPYDGRGVYTGLGLGIELAPPRPESAAYYPMFERAADQPAYFPTERPPETPPVSNASDFTSSPDPRRTRRMRSRASSALTATAAASTSAKSAPVRAGRVTKASKKKRPGRASRQERESSPCLDAPLSVLTAGLTHIPLRDMEAWVQRGPEVRRREAERKGKISRPMNCFMLYRSAFTERTKHWCLQNNHQVVSKVSGKSWPQETPAVREQFYRYAKIERENHRLAHPGYKFSPSKTVGPAKKRKPGRPGDGEAGADGDDDDDYADLEASPAHWLSQLAPAMRGAEEAAAADSLAPGLIGQARSAPDAGPGWAQALDVAQPPPPYAVNLGPATSFAAPQYPGTVTSAMLYAGGDSPSLAGLNQLSMAPQLGLHLTSVPGGGGHHHMYQQMDGSTVGLDEVVMDPALLPYGRSGVDLASKAGWSEGAGGESVVDGDRQSHGLLNSTMAMGHLSASPQPFLGYADQAAAGEMGELGAGWDPSLEPMLQQDSEWQTRADPGSDLEQWCDLANFDA